jgi:hypothetical protein
MCGQRRSDAGQLHRLDRATITICGNHEAEADAEAISRLPADVQGDGKDFLIAAEAPVEESRP